MYQNASMHLYFWYRKFWYSLSDANNTPGLSIGVSETIDEKLLFENIEFDFEDTNQDIADDLQAQCQEPEPLIVLGPFLTPTLENPAICDGKPCPSVSLKYFLLSSRKYFISSFRALDFLNQLVFFFLLKLD